MNKPESLKSKIFAPTKLTVRGSEALYAEQWKKGYNPLQALSPLLSYRPTPPVQHWLTQDFKPGTKFSYLSLTLLEVASRTSINLTWEVLGLLVSGTGLAIFAYSCCRRALDMTYTSPSLEDLFKVELEQSINIEELEKEVLQVEQENKRQLEELVSTPESALKTYLAQITHLVAEGEAEKDFRLKAEKFSEAEILTRSFARASDEASVPELYEVFKNYSRTLSAAQLFFKSVHLMNLARAAKNANDKVAEFLYRTEAFETLTKIHSLKWIKCPLTIRRILYVSAHQLLISDLFEEKTFLSEIKLRTKMFLPSIKRFKNIVDNYRKSKNDYIKSILILSELNNPFRDIEEKIEKVLKKEEEADFKENQSLEISTDTWEEESAFINMLIEDMEEIQGIDSPAEEVEAFERISKKFIEIK